jgi:branched-subunit amino acid transport protein
MTAFLAILATGAGTYFSRSIFILALAHRPIPPNVRRALEYVGPAVLGALIVTMLTTPEGTVRMGPAELSALVLSAGVALKTRNHIYTLLVGMGVFWSVGALL